MPLGQPNPSDRRSQQTPASDPITAARGEPAGRQGPTSPAGRSLGAGVLMVAKNILTCCRPSRDPDDDVVIFKEVTRNQPPTRTRNRTTARLESGRVNTRVRNPMHDVERGSRQSWTARISSGLGRRSSRNPELNAPLSTVVHEHELREIVNRRIFKSRNAMKTTMTMKLELFASRSGPNRETSARGSITFSATWKR